VLPQRAAITFVDDDVHYGGPLTSALKFFDLRVRRLLVRRQSGPLSRRFGDCIVIAGGMNWHGRANESFSSSRTFKRAIYSRRRPLMIVRCYTVL